MNDRENRRVVCAALQDHDGKLILGPRHFDLVMHKSIEAVGGDWRNASQGFIDQWGVYMGRMEAFNVARDADQILNKTGGTDSQELYSEDLY